MKRSPRRRDDAVSADFRCRKACVSLLNEGKYSIYKAQKNLLGDKYAASSTYSRCVEAEAYAKGGNPVYKYFIKA